MKVCGNCGAQNDDDANVCAECSQALDAVTEDVSESKSRDDGLGESSEQGQVAAKSGGPLSSLSKYRSLILNGIILLVSLMTVISGFVGGFRVSVESYDYAYINVNVWHAISVLANPGISANRKGLEKYFEARGEASEEYNEWREKAEAEFDKSYQKAESKASSESDYRRLEKKLYKFEEKCRKKAYSILRRKTFGMNALRYSSLDRMVRVDVKSVAVYVIGAAVIGLAGAVSSIIFALRALLRIMRKDDTSSDLALKLPFTFTGIAMLITGVITLLSKSVLGRPIIMRPGALVTTAFVIAFVGMLATVAYRYLVSGEVGVKSLIFYGVPLAASVVAVLICIFVPNLDITYGGMLRVADTLIFAIMFVLAFGLACSIYYMSSSRLLGKDGMYLVKIFSIALAGMLLLICAVIALDPLHKVISFFRNTVGQSVFKAPYSALRQYGYQRICASFVWTLVGLLVSAGAVAVNFIMQPDD